MSPSPPVYILAQGSYYQPVAEPLPVLKALVEETLGRNVRRINRFIQLALIGAGRCDRNPRPDTAIYLGSNHGDTQSTVEAMDSMYRLGQPPMPLNFINTVSNAACFYVAQQLGLEGASQFVANRYFAVEALIAAAVADVRAGAVKRALVGVVDAPVEPLAAHRQRCGQPPDAQLFDASHWWQLALNKGEQKALAILDDVCHFDDVLSLRQWLLGREKADRLALSGNFPADEAARWLDEMAALRFGGLAGEKTTPGFFATDVASTLSRFIAEGEGRLLHLNRDNCGRYRAVLITSAD
jgi:hypothetical protein